MFLRASRVSKLFLQAGKLLTLTLASKKYVQNHFEMLKCLKV